MSAASNSRECIEGLIGQQIVGVLFGALPRNRPDMSAGKITLVFEDGTGFTFGDGAIGSTVWWHESADEVRAAIREKEAELANISKQHRAMLDLAGLEAQ